MGRGKFGHGIARDFGVGCIFGKIKFKQFGLGILF